MFLHSGSPRGPQPQHGRAGARHRWVPLLGFSDFLCTSVLWSHSSCHLNIEHPAPFSIAQTKQKSGNLCSSAPWGGEGGLQSLGSAAIPHLRLAKRPCHGRAELGMDCCFLSCRKTQGIVRLTWMKMKMRRRKRTIWKMTAWKSPQANPVSEQGSQSPWSKVIMTSDPSVAGGLLKHKLWRGQELIPCCLKSLCQCEFRSW